MRRVLSVCLLAACGCSSGGTSSASGAGGSGTSPQGDCSLRVNLEGEVTEQLDWDLSEGCGGGADAAAATVAMGWGGITIPLNFHVTILDIAEGQLGQGLRATVRVKNGDLTWRTAEGACTVDVSQFEFREQNTVGRSYRVSGSGSCAVFADAAEGGAQGTVGIGPFTFRSTTLYPN